MIKHAIIDDEACILCLEVKVYTEIRNGLCRSCQNKKKEEQKERKKRQKETRLKNDLIKFWNEYAK